MPLETVGVADQYAHRALDVIAQQFPIGPANLLGALPTATATLPTGSFNGQDFYYALTGGGVWHFKYNLTSAKWDFAGGPLLTNEVATSQTTVSTAYAALATAGPSIALPFAGDYLVTLGADMWNTTANNGVLMSYDIGGTGAVDADATQHSLTGGEPAPMTHFRTKLKTGLTAVTLTAKYRAVGGTADFQNRFMGVIPVRVG